MPLTIEATYQLAVLEAGHRRAKSALEATRVDLVASEIELAQSAEEDQSVPENATRTRASASRVVGAKELFSLAKAEEVDTRYALNAYRNSF